MDTHRYSGILLHPTSFPSPYGIGDLGESAFTFIKYLQSAGQSLWQILPLSPTGFGDSPYQGFSAFAGQTLLISPDLLIEDGLLTKEDTLPIPKWNPTRISYGEVIVYKTQLYKKAWAAFQKLDKDSALHTEQQTFIQENAAWLPDYALFMAVKDFHQGRCWLEWDEDIRTPDAQTKEKWRQQLIAETGYYEFIQFLFFRQWKKVKDFANQNGIKIVGDIPIFVSLDSVDVWANQELFMLDTKGYPLKVAGVPPDYFSETGQLWGNPLYDWEAHKASGYAWWIKRIQSQMALVDYLRIDHFRGFDEFWAVPYGEETAINGTWMKGPGKALFTAIEDALGSDLPIFAEDLGVMTPTVEKLRDDLHFPGMKILQFGFENEKDNDMLPHNFPINCICYTGTHDNDTTLGWFNSMSSSCQKRVRAYMQCGKALITWAFIRTALASVARYAIIPLQDVLNLDSSARMNTPGVGIGNWAWRYTAEQLDPDWAAYLKKLTKLYNR